MSCCLCWVVWPSGSAHTRDLGNCSNLTQFLNFTNQVDILCAPVFCMIPVYHVFGSVVAPKKVLLWVWDTIVANSILHIPCVSPTPLMSPCLAQWAAISLSWTADTSKPLSLQTTRNADSSFFCWQRAGQVLSRDIQFLLSLHHGVIWGAWHFGTVCQCKCLTCLCHSPCVQGYWQINRDARVHFLARNESVWKLFCIMPIWVCSHFLYHWMCTSTLGLFLWL